MNRAEIQVWAEARDAELRAGAFQHAVLLLDCEGCLLLWQAAELAEQPDGWVVVFTEHHGLHVFHRDEIVQLQQLAPLDWTERLQLQQTGLDIARRSRTREEPDARSAG